jgi:hypothetical protein
VYAPGMQCWLATYWLVKGLALAYTSPAGDGDPLSMEDLYPDDVLWHLADATWQPLSSSHRLLQLGRSAGGHITECPELLTALVLFLYSVTWPQIGHLRPTHTAAVVSHLHLPASGLPPTGHMD